MKSFCLTLFVLLIPFVLLSQWYWQRPDPTGANLKDSYFLDENNGWMVGDGGVVIITNDGCESWQQVYTNELVDLKSVFHDVQRVRRSLTYEIQVTRLGDSPKVLSRSSRTIRAPIMYMPSRASRS